MRHARKNKHGAAERGSISVETALLLPIRMLLVLAFIDIGRYMWTQTVVSSAAAEAARVAVLNEPADSAVVACATDRVRKGGISDTPSVTVGARTASQPVSVTVRVGFDFLTLAQLDPDIAGHWTITATSAMTHQP
jgi:Flp pilus assembly protein TadG